MSSSRIIQVIKWLLFALVIGAPLFYWKWSLYPYAVPKTAFFEALVELIFALWIALAISDKRYRPRMTPLMWAISAYLFILTITAFTGVDTWRSFFSDLERAFGIVMYYHLAALAVVVSSLAREIPWKKLWYASFGTSVAIVGIALIQLQAHDFLLFGDMVGGRPGSTFGNPTFLAGYLLLNIFLAGYFLSKSQIREKIFLLATIAIDIVGIFITATRGDLLGLFAGVLALAVFFAIRPPAGQHARPAAPASSWFRKRSFYILFAAILIVAAGGIWFTRGGAIWDGVPGIDRLKSITLSENSDLGPRLMALDAGWKGFLERPLLGWGFENFNAVFSAHYNPKVLEFGYGESNFDKPHNVVLEMLDAGGVFLLAAYLAVLGALAYESWRLNDHPLAGPFIAALIVAYFARSVVVFDTIGPAMTLYLAFGWVDGRYREVILKQSARASAVGGGILVATMIPAFIVAYVLNGTAFAAGAASWSAHASLQDLNDPATGVPQFASETDQWSVYQWDFVRDYANTIAQAHFYNPVAIPSSAIRDAVSKMNEVAIEHPNDAYNHYLLTDIYNLAHDVDPQNYLPEAEKQARAALRLSPNRQEIYFYLVKTKSLEGDNAGAFALAKTALDLDPKVADAHFYYGMLAFANRKNDIGYAEVKRAVAQGRQWHDFYEPRVAGDYFADSGHLTEAIALYQAALALQPSDLETEIKLGAAYFFSGDRNRAKQYLADAAARFDFKKSPAYGQYKPILDALGIPR